MIARFEIGKVYACRSTCDYDCIFSARVVARTEKTVTFEEEHRGRYTCRPHLWRDVESVYPHGRFSMCPVFSADRTLEQVINPPTRAQQEKPTMKAKPAATRGTVHAETGKPPVKASKPTAPAKPAAQAPKPAEAAKPEAKPAETWPKMIARHAVELRKLNASDKPHNGPDVRFLSGVYVPAENATAYREAMTRHANERAALRDNPTTARAVFEWALTEYKGDEALALYALGVMFTADPAGIVAPALRRVRELAEVWRDALQAVKPDAVSKIVTVRALGPKPKPAEKKPEAKPATAPAKPAEAAKPATDAKKPADKPAKPAQKPVEVEKPKGMGMVAKIEAKADTKPAKAKPKK